MQVIRYVYKSLLKTRLTRYLKSEEIPEQIAACDAGLTHSVFSVSLLFTFAFALRFSRLLLYPPVTDVYKARLSIRKRCMTHCQQCHPRRAIPNLPDNVLGLPAPFSLISPPSQQHEHDLPSRPTEINALRICQNEVYAGLDRWICASRPAVEQRRADGRGVVRWKGRNARGY